MIYNTSRGISNFLLKITKVLHVHSSLIDWNRHFLKVWNKKEKNSFVIENFEKEEHNLQLDKREAQSFQRGHMFQEPVKILPRTITGFFPFLLYFSTSFPLFMTHLFDYNMYKYHSRCNQEGVGQVRHRQENTGLTMLPYLNPAVLRLQSAFTVGRFHISGFK